VRFVVRVVSWLCLAQPGSDWEGLSEGLVGWVRRGGCKEGKRK